MKDFFNFGYVVGCILGCNCGVSVSYSFDVKEGFGWFVEGGDCDVVGLLKEEIVMWVRIVKECGIKV